MRVNEMDKLCFMCYLVGGFVALMSVIGFLVVLFFKDLPGTRLYFNFSHSGVGVIQGILLIVLGLIFFGAVKFIHISNVYHIHYGE